jgi:hypothetical protein
VIPPVSIRPRRAIDTLLPSQYVLWGGSGGPASALRAINIMARPAKKFSYYGSLSRRQRRIYDKSDSIEAVPLPRAGRFSGVIDELRTSLAADSLPRTERAVERLVDGLCRVFEVPRIHVKILDRRPSGRGGEMHGLYESEAGKLDVLTVWMRTAKRKQTVAFRTFLRTVVHEFLHHLDFAYFDLSESFHTQGFFKRESSLVRQLLGEEQERRA